MKGMCLQNPSKKKIVEFLCQAKNWWKQKLELQLLYFLITSLIPWETSHSIEKVIIGFIGAN